MFEIVGALITSFFEPRLTKKRNGAYILARNQSGEEVIIHDPYGQSVSIKNDEKYDEMSILLLKCERLISHFKSTMNLVKPGKHAHALNNRLVLLVNHIIYDIENGITSNMDEYHERYSHIRSSVTETSMSRIDLNHT